MSSQPQTREVALKVLSLGRPGPRSTEEEKEKGKEKEGKEGKEEEKEEPFYAQNKNVSAASLEATFILFRHEVSIMTAIGAHQVFSLFFFFSFFENKKNGD